MLLIQSSLADIPQQIADRHTNQFFQTHVDKIKVKQHVTGKVDLFEQHIDAADQQQESHCIRFYNVGKFQPASLYPFGCIQIKCIIQNQINRDNSKQCCHIPLKRQAPDRIAGKRTHEF